MLMSIFFFFPIKPERMENIFQHCYDVFHYLNQKDLGPAQSTMLTSSSMVQWENNAVLEGMGIGSAAGVVCWAGGFR